MVFRVYFESAKKWAKEHNKTVYSSIGLIISFMIAFNMIEVISYSDSVACLGDTWDNACEFSITFKANDDIFLYPMNYDPWGRDTFIQFEPGVKDWKLYRTWGDSLREINLSKGCTGTWCGKTKSDTRNESVYSIAFRKDKIYTIVVKALKENPKDIIKWTALDGKIDPYFWGIDKFGNEIKDSSLIDSNIRVNSNWKIRGDASNWTIDFSDIHSIDSDIIVKSKDKKKTANINLKLKSKESKIKVKNDEYKFKCNDGYCQFNPELIFLKSFVIGDYGNSTYYIKVDGNYTPVVDDYWYTSNGKHGVNTTEYTSEYQEGKIVYEFNTPFNFDGDSVFYKKIGSNSLSDEYFSIDNSDLFNYSVNVTGTNTAEVYFYWVNGTADPTFYNYNLSKGYFNQTTFFDKISILKEPTIYDYNNVIWHVNFGENGFTDIKNDESGTDSGSNWWTGSGSIVDLYPSTTSDDVEYTAANSLFTGTNNYTLCSWVKYNGGYNTSVDLLGKKTGFNLGTQNGQWAIESSGTSCSNTLGGNLIINKWTFLCGTYNHSKQVLYIDGDIIATESCTEDPSISNNIEIGSSGSEFWNFSIGETLFWNVSLNSNNITEIYNLNLFSYPQGEYYSEVKEIIFTGNQSDNFENGFGNWINYTGSWNTNNGILQERTDADSGTYGFVSYTGEETWDVTEFNFTIERYDNSGIVGVCMNFNFTDGYCLSFQSPTNVAFYRLVNSVATADTSQETISTIRDVPTKFTFKNLKNGTFQAFREGVLIIQDENTNTIPETGYVMAYQDFGFIGIDNTSIQFSRPYNSLTDNYNKINVSYNVSCNGLSCPNVSIKTNNFTFNNLTYWIGFEDMNFINGEIVTDYTKKFSSPIFNPLGLSMIKTDNLGRRYLDIGTNYNTDDNSEIEIRQTLESFGMSHNKYNWTIVVHANFEKSGGERFPFVDSTNNYILRQNSNRIGLTGSNGCDWYQGTVNLPNEEGVIFAGYNSTSHCFKYNGNQLVKGTSAAIGTYSTGDYCLFDRCGSEEHTSNLYNTSYYNIMIFSKALTISEMDFIINYFNNTQIWNETLPKTTSDDSGILSYSIDNSSTFFQTKFDLFANETETNTLNNFSTLSFTQTVGTTTTSTTTTTSSTTTTTLNCDGSSDCLIDCSVTDNIFYDIIGTVYDLIFYNNGIVNINSTVAFNNIFVHNTCDVTVDQTTGVLIEI